MKRIYILLTLIVLNTSLSFAQDEGMLTPGMQAPPLKIQEWIKGKPVSKFEKGHVYVVEFTATWCPPCMAVIPHLTELAKQFSGQVSFVSIYIDDNNKVRKLVNAMGDKISFTVGVDVPQQKTWETFYLWKVNGNGPPRAFIVDKTGNIAWAGHPAYLDSDLIKSVVDDTYDVRITMQHRKKYDRCLDDILELRELGNNLLALHKIDSLIGSSSQVPPTLYFFKFRVLAGYEDEKANELLRWLLSNNIEGTDWSHLAWFAWELPKKPDFDLALLVADRAIEEAITSDDKIKARGLKINIYSVRSRTRTSVTEAKSDLNEAIKICNQLLEYWKSVGDSSQVQAYQSTLKMFKGRIENL